MDRKISIITSTYNSAKTLEEAISSVVRQTYVNIEYIVVDGGSKDGTLDIIQKYRNSIKYFISEPDKGVYDAFNKGINLASGEVIYFLNSDDYLHRQDVIEQVMTIFNNNQSIDYLYANILLWDEELKYFEFFGREMNVNDLMRGIMPPHPAFFIKKHVLLENGLFDMKYKSSSDFDLVVKCFKNQRYSGRYINLITAVFRLGGLSNNPTTAKQAQLETKTIIKTHFELDEQALGEYNTDEYYRLWMELSLLRKRNITDGLSGDFSKVAIFGAKKNALYVIEDCKKSNLEVVALLDNSPYIQGLRQNGIQIYAPSLLANNKGLIDAVIIAAENIEHEMQMREQIATLCGRDNIPCFSWKELLLKQFK